MKNKIISILIFFYLLSSFYFYQPQGIDERIFKAISFVLFTILVIISSFAPKGFKNSRLRFRTPIVIIIVAMIISIFMSYYLWNQSLVVGYLTTMPFLTYYLYFVLVKSEVSNIIIEKMIVVIIMGYMVLFIITMITFPMVYFGAARMEMGRGGLRIGMGATIFLVLGFFIAINKYLIYKKILWLIWAIICYVFIIMTFTRQLIFACSLLGLLFLLKSITLPKKIFVITIVTIVLLYIIPNINVFNNLLNTSIDQYTSMNSYKEDIRISAMKYFIAEASSSNLAKIFGNGVPSFGNSEYGNHMERIFNKNHYYMVDVGFAGFYYLFGILGISGVVLLFYKAIKIKTHGIYLYAKYFLACIFVVSFTSGVLLYQGQLITVVLATYILDNQEINGNK